MKRVYLKLTVAALALLFAAGCVAPLSQEDQAKLNAALQAADSAAASAASADASADRAEAAAKHADAAAKSAAASAASAQNSAAKAAKAYEMTLQK